MADTAFFNPHDGLTGRDGGPYLDQEERRLAEIRRAAIEGREPDLKTPAATAGTPLVTARILATTAGVNSTPSQENYDAEEAAVLKLAADPESPLEVFGSAPVAEAPVEPAEFHDGE